MRKMKMFGRATVAILILAVMLLSAVSCGGGDSSVQIGSTSKEHSDNSESGSGKLSASSDKESNSQPETGTSKNPSSKPIVSGPESSSDIPSEGSSPASAQTEPVSSFDESSKASSFTEKVPVTGISASFNKTELSIGEVTGYTVKVTPGNADNKKYNITVSDPTVVKVANGTVTALKEGRTEVIFQTEDGGFTSKVSVTVTAAAVVYPASYRYDPETGLPNYTPVFEDGVEYEDFPAKNIKHIFSHDLVAFSDPTEHFFRECLTVKEFKAILEQLYKNDYILIDIDYMYEYKYVDGRMTAALKSTVKIPKGKKPIVLSVDNVAYPEDNYSSARISGLQVVNGELKTFVRGSNGAISYVEDGDVFPILEKFIQEHPDFSFSGAKCVVCPSGTWGVFGWDTHLGAVNYQANVIEARKVAQWFADNGYAFACHSYYHKGVDKMTVAEINEDFAKWNAEVYPIIGRTHVYIYPLGAVPQYGFNKPMVEQGQALIDAGYSVFCGTALEGYSATNYLFNGTAFIERITLSSWTIIYFKDDARMQALFDPYTVYDNDVHSQKIK